MNKALRLYHLIGDNRGMTNESLDRCVGYEQSLSFIDKRRFSYYVARDNSKNIIHTFWNMFWW